MTAQEIDKAIVDAFERAGTFDPKPYYQRDGDSVILYARNVPSQERWVNHDLTLFVAQDDDTLVGCEIKNITQKLKLAKNLGMFLEDRRVPMRVLLLCALGSQSNEPKIEAWITKNRTLFEKCGQLEMDVPAGVC